MPNQILGEKMTEDMRKYFHDMCSKEMKIIGDELSEQEIGKLFDQWCEVAPTENMEEIVNLSQDLTNKQAEVLKIIQVEASKNDLTTIKNIEKELPEFVATVIEKELHGLTLFELACKFGSYDVAKYFISAGAKFRTDQYLGAVALTEASNAGHYEIVDLILKSFGESLNYEHISIASMYAIGNNQADILSLFIDAGLDVNFGVNGGASLIVLAASCEAIDVVKLSVFVKRVVAFSFELNKSSITPLIHRAHRVTRML